MATVAAALGITARQVQRLVAAKILPAPAHGRYDLVRLIPAWVAYVEADRGSDATLADAKRRYWQARAEGEELATARLAASLIAFADVESAVWDMFATLATQLDALASRVAAELASESDAAVVRRRLLEEIRRVRGTIADDFEARAAVLRGGDAAPPAAAANGDGMGGDEPDAPGRTR